MTKFAIAVHGGAWAIPDDQVEAHRLGCRNALSSGLRVLSNGGSSLDAVEATVVELENDPTFGAGLGSVLNEEGQIELDAGIMDGRTLDTGSVAAVAGVRNPVVLARRVLDSPLAVIVGAGAHHFALQHGVNTCAPEELVVEREQLRWSESSGAQEAGWNESFFGDTVGAVAMDQRGDLAAATSTGGSPRKPAGRVGDSPFVGAGLYADNEAAAVSATGHGELIIPLVWSKAAADIARDGTPAPQGAKVALGLLQRLDARAGLIMVDREGRIGVSWNTLRMAYAYADDSTDEIVDGPRF